MHRDMEAAVVLSGDDTAPALIMIGKDVRLNQDRKRDLLLGTFTRWEPSSESYRRAQKASQKTGETRLRDFIEYRKEVPLIQPLFDE